MKSARASLAGYLFERQQKYCVHQVIRKFYPPSICVDRECQKLDYEVRKEQKYSVQDIAISDISKQSEL